MTPLFQTIVDQVEPPKPMEMALSNEWLTTTLPRGCLRSSFPWFSENETAVTMMKVQRVVSINLLLPGLERHEADEAQAGDIIAITGLGELKISDTICEQNAVEALFPLSVDEPTVTMTFPANTSPFAGKEGKFVASRNILSAEKRAGSQR